MRNIKTLDALNAKLKQAYAEEMQSFLDFGNNYEDRMIPYHIEVFRDKNSTKVSCLYKKVRLVEVTREIYLEDRVFKDVEVYVLKATYNKKIIFVESGYVYATPYERVSGYNKFPKKIGGFKNIYKCPCYDFERPVRDAILIEFGANSFHQVLNIAWLWEHNLSESMKQFADRYNVLYSDMAKLPEYTDLKEIECTINRFGGYYDGGIIAKIAAYKKYSKKYFYVDVIPMNDFIKSCTNKSTISAMQWCYANKFPYELGAPGCVRQLKKLLKKYQPEFLRNRILSESDLGWFLAEDDLRDAFIKKYKRAPKIISLLAHQVYKGILSKDVIINNFDYKIIAKIVNRYNDFDYNNRYAIYCHMAEAVKMALVYTGNNRNIIPVLNEVIYRFANNEGDKFIKSNVFRWILSNWQTCRSWSVGNTNKVINSWEDLDAVIDGMRNLNDIDKYLTELRSSEDLELAERRYKFNFADCRFELPETSVSHYSQRGVLTAHMLPAGDKRMLTIGYDTYCCQHMNGVGETAMMYGILAPKAGFWIIEDQNGNIKAQAEIWEGKYVGGKQVLVFDNIEYANDADASTYHGLVMSWCDSSPYDDIIIGLGCNANTYNGKTVYGDAIVQPRSGNRKLDSEYIYSDTGKCIIVKKGGKMQEINIIEKSSRGLDYDGDENDDLDEDF